jgi:hypothetical protein
VPVLNELAKDAEVQVTVRPDVTSVTVVVPAVPVVDPPGETDQVALIVLADAELATRPSARVADARVNSAPTGLRILPDPL